MASVVRSHPIIEVRDGYVVCGGPQLTALQHGAQGTTETHELLRPTFHDGDYQAVPGARVEVGDAIDEFDDGSKHHRTIPKQQNA